MARVSSFALLAALLWLSRAGPARAQQSATETPTATTETVSESSQAEPDVEIVARGQRPVLVHSPRSASAASTVLTEERLDRTGDSAADVLRQVPGVQVYRSGAESDRASINIRGAGGHQIPVYIAGIRINDEVSGFADLSTVPLWMMQRVEIFRGNAPPNADQMGLGGAVFFEPKKAKQTRVGGFAHVGSYGARSGWLGAEVAGQEASALVAVRGSAADNDYPFLNDHGQRFVLNEEEERRPNADAEAVDSWAIGEFRLGSARLLTVSNVLDREQGVTGVATTPARRARAHTRRLLTGASLAVPCDERGDCEWGTSSGVLVENITTTDPNRELRSARSPWVHSRGQRLSQLVYGQLSFWDALSWRGSLRVTTDSLDLVRTASAPHHATRDLVRIGTSADFEASRSLLLNVALGANCYVTRGRFIDVGRRMTERRDECTVSRPDAHLGLSYQLLDEVFLLANVAHALRLPTLGELYGSSPVMVGEPELRPETSINVDVGSRAQWDWDQVQFAVDGFLFQRWAEDLVRYQQTSLFAFAPYNVASAELRGAELSVGARFASLLTSQTAITVLDARDTTPDVTAGNDVVPLLSRLVLSQGLELGQEEPAWNMRWAAVGARYFYRSNRYADPAGLLTLPQLSLWDFHGRVRLQRPDLELMLSVNNALDVRALDIIGLPLPARAVHASVEAWW